MHLVLRSALDRLIYEGAVAIHMLRLAPLEYWSPMDARGRTALSLVSQLARDLEALATWVEQGLPAADAIPSVPEPVFDEREQAIEALKSGLRRLFAAAQSVPEWGVPDAVLRELWISAAMFTAAREGLSRALPDVEEDPVVQRWWRAPLPPVEPPTQPAVDEPASPR